MIASGTTRLHLGGRNIIDRIDHEIASEGVTAANLIPEAADV